MKTMQITDKSQLNYLYEMRYKVFIEREKDAPKELFSDGLIKEEIDDHAVHIGCFEGETLLGFVSLAFKEKTGYLPVERQFGILCEKYSAEIMYLMIIAESIKERAFVKRGRVLKSLLSATKEVSESNNTKFIYLVSLKSTQKLYEKLGFSQIGEYQPYYKNFSLECPMKLLAEDVRLI